MQNVIAFPQTVKPEPAAAISRGAKTLFVHIRRSTMIVHFGGAPVAPQHGTRASKQH